MLGPAPGVADTAVFEFAVRFTPSGNYTIAWLAYCPRIPTHSGLTHLTNQALTGTTAGTSQLRVPETSLNCLNIN